MRNDTVPVPSLRRSAPLTSNSICRVNRIARAALLLVGLACILQMPVLAQQPATISGFLSDPSGAGVPGANLTLTNQDTTVVLMTAKSDSSGNFAFPSVPAPGTYSIAVQVGGFTRYEQKDITVTAGERRSVGTIALAVGSNAESVTVQADTTPVQTESAERSASLDRHEIGALLARGLNYGSLLRSLPGISGGADPTGPGGNTTNLSEHQRNPRQRDDSKYRWGQCGGSIQPGSALRSCCHGLVSRNQRQNVELPGGIWRKCRSCY
jgi:hypothetical protein